MTRGAVGFGTQSIPASLSAFKKYTTARSDPPAGVRTGVNEYSPKSPPPPLGFSSSTAVTAVTSDESTPPPVPPVRTSCDIAKRSPRHCERLAALWNLFAGNDLHSACNARTITTVRLYATATVSALVRPGLLGDGF